MILQVTSHRGHHEATVLEPEVSKAIFDKLTGKTDKALPEALKTKIPDTWHDLEALWKDGPGGYVAFQKDAEENLLPVREYSPELPKVAFIAPQTGG